MHTSTVRRSRSIISALLVLGASLSCSSSNEAAGGASGPAIQLVEFPFEKQLGEQRRDAWSTSNQIIYDCLAPVGGDRFLNLTGSNRVVVNGKGTLSPQHVELYDHKPVAPLPGEPAGSPPKPVWRWLVDIEEFRDDTTQNSLEVLRCPVLLATAEGGAILYAQVHNINAGGKSPGWLFARIGPDGALQWRKRVENLNIQSMIELRDKKIAALRSIGTSTVTTIFSSTGEPGEDTPIPNDYVPEFDKPGTGNPGAPPGLGKVGISALAPAKDGGFVAAGGYKFDRNIACGSQLAPRDPEGSTCGNDAINGLMARFDSAGKIVWISRIGKGYLSQTMYFTTVKELSDGAVLATGTMQTEVGIVQGPHMLGLAVRYSASGSPEWAKGLSWGPLPGAGFFAGGTTISAIASVANGAADVVMELPKDVPTRILRLEADGSVSRVQPLPTKMKGLAQGEDLYVVYDAITRMAL